jgi:hypothetical protein
MKKVTYILISFVLGVISFSCEDESTFNNPSHNELERGAFIRFANTIPTNFNPDIAQEVEISEQIFDPNGNAAQYDLSVTYQLGSTGEIYTADNFITITSFPSTLTITSQMIADATGADLADFGAGDLATFYATVTRNDGLKFIGIEPEFDDETGVVNSVDVGVTQGNLITSAAYNSAMQFGYVLACPINDALYTGKYMMEVTGVASNCFGAVFFDQEVELTAISVYQREFSAIYLEQFGFGNLNPYTIDFICGTVTFASTQGTGLGCSGSLILTSSASPGPYEVGAGNDTTLVVKLVEDCTGCGGAVEEIELTFTKL